MNALLEGRTVVAIAHRLHTAHDADRIAVVIDGRIAELGSHDELVDRGRRVRRACGGPGRARRPGPRVWARDASQVGFDPPVSL